MKNQIIDAIKNLQNTVAATVAQTLGVDPAKCAAKATDEEMTSWEIKVDIGQPARNMQGLVMFTYTSANLTASMAGTTALMDAGILVGAKATPCTIDLMTMYTIFTNLNKILKDEEPHEGNN